MPELVVRVEGAEGSAVEEVQESEHEVQEQETEAWRDALLDVTGQLAELSQRVTQALEVAGNQSGELRQLVETQREMIRDLQAANQTANQTLLETVQRLLTPAVAIVETPIETPPVEAPALAEPTAAVVVEPERTRRYRGL